MQMRSSSIVLKYKQTKATNIVNKDLESFSWTDVANGEADRVSLRLNNRIKKWLKGYFPKEKDYFKIWLKVNHWRWNSDNRKKFCGKFQVDDFSASGFANTFNLEGISIPIHTGFNVTQRSKTYKKTSVKSILKDIAKRADVKLVYDAENHKIDEISQSGKTDMEFAFSVCEDYGLSMKVYNSKLVVYDQTKYEKRAISFTIDINDIGGSDAYSYKRNITSIYDGVKLQYQNKDGDDITYKYVLPGKKGKRILVISTSADNHADAERKAKAQLASNLRSAETLTLKLMGDPKYLACQTFELTGFGKINGKYFIDKVTHSIEGGYKTTIVAHPVVTQIG